MMYVPDPRSKHNQRKGNRTPTGTASTAKKHEIAKINICGSQCYDTSTPEGEVLRGPPILVIIVIF